MRRPIEIVALDTGIYIAGLLTEGLTAGRSLAPAIIAAAKLRRFRTLFLNTVFDELREGSSWSQRAEEKLLDFLDEADAIWKTPTPIPNRHNEEDRFTRLLRHQADAKIAAEVLYEYPDYFVHDNAEHWGRLGGRIEEIQVVKPREFLALLKGKGRVTGQETG